jgi:hypothetical protein
VNGGVTTFAVELIPRITRAQAMDALSSMATVAGYKAGADWRFIHSAHVSFADDGRRNCSTGARARARRWRCGVAGDSNGATDLVQSSKDMTFAQLRVNK